MDNKIFLGNQEQPSIHLRDDRLVENYNELMESSNRYFELYLYTYKIYTKLAKVEWLSILSLTGAQVKQINRMMTAVQEGSVLTFLIVLLLFLHDIMYFIKLQQIKTFTYKGEIYAKISEKEFLFHLLKYNLIHFLFILAEIDLEVLKNLYFKNIK